MNISIQEQLNKLNEQLHKYHQIDSDLKWLWEKYPEVSVVLTNDIDLHQYKNQFVKLSEIKITKDYQLILNDCDNQMADSFVIVYDFCKNLNYFELIIFPFLSIEQESLRPKIDRYSYRAFLLDKNKEVGEYESEPQYWRNDKFEIINDLRFNNYSSELISKVIIQCLENNQDYFPDCPLKRSFQYQDYYDWMKIKYDLDYAERW